MVKTGYISTTTKQPIPRPEYPRPQLMRSDWLNLNGIWEFEKDAQNTGIQRQLHHGGTYTQKINVPFAPESELSGLADTEFVPYVWYRRTFTIPKDWRKNNKRVLIHFGGVDYEATIWINRKQVFFHRGRHTRFDFDITPYLNENGNENEIVVRAFDNVLDPDQPLGKQKTGLEKHFCSYTRETGITQTVWLESVASTYIKALKFNPNIDDGTLTIQFALDGDAKDIALEARALIDGRQVGYTSVSTDYQALVLPLSELHLWEPGNPFLYDLELILHDKGMTIDRVTSYFGMRKISIIGDKFLINDKSYFQRLILDQGFYPDGLYTAPSDEAMKKDIEIAQAMGFNGARAHQKKFEERYLYWADKLGYLLWGEIGSWGPDYSRKEAQDRLIAEWSELLPEYVNHASIVGYIPLNEARDIDPKFLEKIFEATKLYDPTRPAIDTSGHTHGDITDVYDVHPYTPDVEEFRNYCESVLQKTHPEHPKYNGQPFGVMEWGGIFYDPLTAKEITIGEDVGYAYALSGDELVNKYDTFMTTLLNMDKVFASCYTQLYDTEQENNGLYDKYRNPKVDPEKIRAINMQPAAYEKMIQQSN